MFRRLLPVLIGVGIVGGGLAVVHNRDGSESISFGSGSHAVHVSVPGFGTLMCPTGMLNSIEDNVAAAAKLEPHNRKLQREVRDMRRQTHTKAGQAAFIRQYNQLLNKKDFEHSYRQIMHGDPRKVEGKCTAH